MKRKNQNMIMMRAGIFLPAASSFLLLILLTRVLSPSELGIASLALMIAMLFQTCAFNGIDMIGTRLASEYQSTGRSLPFEGTLLKATVSMWSSIPLGAAIIAAFGVHLGFPISVVVSSAVLIALRSISSQRIVLARAYLDGAKSLKLEAIQAFAILLSSFAFVVPQQTRGIAPIIGAAVGCLAVIAADWPRVRRAVSSCKLVDISIVRMAIPMAGGFAFAYLVSTLDRYMIAGALGADALGQFTASYNLADRSIQMIAMVAGAGSLQVLMSRLGQADRVRETYRQNVAVVVGIALPAALGLAALAAPASQLLFGQEYQVSASNLLPWLAIAALMAYVKAYAFDHTFYAAHRPWLLVASMVPAAVIKVAGNAILLPHVGVIGAGYSGVAAYAAALGACIFLNPLRAQCGTPWPDVSKIALASAIMLVSISLVQFSSPTSDLLVSLTLGVAVYGVAVLALNIANIQSVFARLIGARHA